MNCNDFPNWESVRLYCRFLRRCRGYVSNEVSARSLLSALGQDGTEGRRGRSSRVTKAEDANVDVVQ